MRTLILTGTGGTGSALGAAATAHMAAAQGTKTLLVSVGPSHALTGLLQAKASSTPQPSGTANLDFWAVDTPAALSELYERMRSYLFGTLKQLSGDELPLIPGVEFFVVVEWLSRQPANSYPLVVLDAGPHDALLRVLSLPDSFRWGVRLLFGLDREPGRSMASLSRALVPTSLLPVEWMSPVQQARVRFEQVRDTLTRPDTINVRYVVRPDAPALDEARLAIPAIHLHGIAVDSLVVGPLLPADLTDPRLSTIVTQQQTTLAEVGHLWEPRPVLSLPQMASDGSNLAGLGQVLYADHNPLEVLHRMPPISYHEGNEGNDPFIALSLPGLPREALSLTLSGDELIVRVGSYRRHLLLPAGLRGMSNVRASRDGERLIIRFKQ